MAKGPIQVEIEAKLKEGSAEKAVGQVGQEVAAASEKASKAAERASERRLRAIQRENEALRNQLALLNQVAGLGTALPRGVDRGRAQGRSIRQGLNDPSVDLALRMALDERAILQEREAQRRRRLQGRLRAGQAGVSKAFADQALGFQVIQLERQIGGGVRGVGGRQLLQVAERFGGYEGLAAGAKKAGVSLQEFIRIKSGATAAEARNERQLKTLNKEQEATHKATQKATGGFAQMGRVLRSLLTAFVGFQVFRLLQNSITDLIDFQAKLQNVRLGVAEILLVGNRFRDRVTGQLLSIGDQVKQSFQLAERGTTALVEKAIQLGLPLDTLVASFQTVAGIATASGVGFKDTLDIISQIGVVAQRLNIPFNQLTRSIDNIFTGLRVQQTQLGVILQLNQKIVQEQIQQGTLGKFLLERLQGVAETLPQNLKTFEGIRQSLRSLILDLSRRLTGGAFQVLQDSLSAIREKLLAIRGDRDFVDRFAHSFAELARNVAESAKQMGALASNPFVRALVGAGIGGRYGGAAGAAIGGAYGGGLIGTKTALAAVAGVELGRAALRRVTPEAVGGAGGALAGSAAVRLITGFGAAISPAISGLAQFALGLGVVTASLLLLKKWSDAIAENRSEIISSKISGAESRRTTRAFTIVGALQRQLTPESLEAIRQQAYFGTDADKEAARDRVAGFRDSVGRLGALIPTLSEPIKRRILQSALEDFESKLVSIEAADPFKQLAQRLESELKSDKDLQKVAADRLAVLKAQNEITVQQVEGTRRLLEVEKEKLALQEDILRATADREIAEARLSFQRGSGRVAGEAASRESLLRGRLGRTDRLIGLAEGAGRLDVVGALQAEKQRLQQEIFALQQQQQQAAIGQAELERTGAEKQLSVEEQVARMLPERLRIEREILNLKIAQAQATAAAANEEQRVANEQVARLNERIASAQADRDRIQKSTGQTLSPSDPVNKTITEYEGLRAQFELKSLEAEGRSKSANIEAEVLRRQGALQGDRDRLAREQQATKVAQAEGQVLQAKQGVNAEIAKGKELEESKYDLLLDQIEAHERLNESLGGAINLQRQLVGNAKQFLSDLFQGDQKFSEQIKNFGKNIARAISDALANTIVNFLQGKAQGGSGSATDFIKSIGSIFDTSSSVAQLFGGGGAGVNAASAARLKSGVGLIGAGAPSAGGAAAGAAGGASGTGGLIGGLAGAAGAGGGAVTLAALAAIAGTQGFIEGQQRARKDPRATADSIARAGRREAFQSAGNIIPVIGPIAAKAFTKATDSIKVKDRGSAAGSGAATGALIGTIVPGIGNLVGAILGAILGAALFGVPTTGTQQAKFLSPDLQSIGLINSVRFGPGNKKIYTAFTGANARRGGIPASYASIRDSFSGFGLAGKQSSFGKISPSAFGTLDTAIAASVLGAAEDLNLAAPDTFTLGKELTKSLTEDYRKGGFRILGQNRRGRLSQDQLLASLGGLIVSYQDLSAAIDGATLAQAAFTTSGQISLKALEDAASAAKTVIEQGIPQALSAAVRSGNPIDAARTLAQTFTDSFLNQLGQSLINSGGIQKALTEATALATQAAEAYAVGDYARGDELAAQASRSFITGRNQVQATTNRLYPRVLGFNASVGVFGPGGVINPSGSGLPGYATPSAVRVPGPVGQPRLAVLHGDEVVREGAHNDALVAAMNNVAEAQRALADVLVKRDGGETKVEVQIDGAVVASATRKADRRDSLGRGIKVPIATLGAN